MTETKMLSQPAPTGAENPVQIPPTELKEGEEVDVTKAINDLKGSIGSKIYRLGVVSEEMKEDFAPDELKLLQVATLESINRLIEGVVINHPKEEIIKAIQEDPEIQKQVDATRNAVAKIMESEPEKNLEFVAELFKK